MKFHIIESCKVGRIVFIASTATGDLHNGRLWILNSNLRKGTYEKDGTGWYEVIRSTHSKGKSSDEPEAAGMPHHHRRQETPPLRVRVLRTERTALGLICAIHNGWIEWRRRT